MGLGATGAVANQGIKLNTLGLTMTFRITPQVTVAGSASFIFSDLVNVDASPNFLSGLVGVHIKDVFSKGGAVGLLAGQLLHRVGTGGRAVDPKTANPFQVEGYINYRINDNISVTLGVFVIFNPEGFSENNTVIVPAIRTNFTF